MEKTNRGFDITSFKDANGEQCSLQKSSSAMEDKIWLGVHENRMHLTQEQVSELLPYLVNFVRCGELEGDAITIRHDPNDIKCNWDYMPYLTPNRTDKTARDNFDKLQGLLKDMDVKVDLPPCKRADN